MNRNDLVMANDIGELLEEPNEMRFEWRISDFFSLKSEVDAMYSSPKFLFSDTAWRLLIYPNGRTCNKSEGKIGLFLQRLDCGSLRTVSFTFGIKKTDGTEEIIVRHKDTFDKKALGMANFLIRSDLLSRKSELAPSDVVTVTCVLKRECSIKVLLFNRLWDLSRNLKDILDAKRRTDVVFKLKGEEIPAHRMILESRSTVFKRMFDVDMKEAQTGEVKLVDVDKDAFRVVLSYVYSCELDGLSRKNMLQVYKVAHKYELQDLRELCVDFMNENLATDCICDVFALAHLYEEKSLKESAKQYFVSNKTEIFKSEAWKICKMNSPEIGFELVECAFGRID